MFWKIKKSKVKKRGFTLIEALVAVFIFALMMTAVSNIFAKIIRTHHDTRNVQENLESAQYAMNLMMKTLRTSSVVNDGSSNLVRIYDYSQQKCIQYEFSGSSLLYSSAGGGDEITCATDALTVNPNLVEGSISSGTFDTIASSKVVGSEAMGKATISMTVSQGNDTVHIQSSVSLRDYGQALP